MSKRTKAVTAPLSDRIRNVADGLGYFVNGRRAVSDDQLLSYLYRWAKEVREMEDEKR